MPRLNVALLDQTMEHIEKLDAQWREWWEEYPARRGEQPADRWDQGIYGEPNMRYDYATGEETQCDTAACFAGWALVLTGHDLLKEYERTGDPATDAMEELGLTPEQANWLFDASNDLTTLRILVNRIKLKDL